LYCLFAKSLKKNITIKEVNMKRIFLAASAIFLFSLFAQAQSEGSGNEDHNIFVQQTSNVELYSSEPQQPETLISNKIHSSGYGVLSTQYSKFNHQDAIFVGAYGGWMINHKLMLGLGGYALATTHKGFGINPVTNEQNKLRMGYGGLMAEYTFAGNKAFHVTANALVGAGGITNGYEKKGDNNDEDNWHNVKASAFFVAQPGLNVEANLTKWFRVSAGGSYRLIAGNNLPGISNKDMSAPAANLSFKFGEF
jgi:hypothetical protein